MSMEKKNDGPPKGRYVQEERRRTKPLDMQESLRLQKEFAAAQRAASQAAPQNAPKSTLRANPKTATAKKSVPTKAEQLKKPNLKKDLQLESSLPTSSEQEEQPLNPQMDFKNVDFSLERLQKEATWRLWEEKKDQNLNAIPEYFENVESYISVFEPLLFEECRSQLRNCWEEVSDPSNLNREAHVKVKVTKVEILEGGWIEVNLEPTEKRKMYQNEKNWRENDVAVLSSSQPSSITHHQRFKRGPRNPGKSSDSERKPSEKAENPSNLGGNVEDGPEEGELVEARIAGVAKRHFKGTGSRDAFSFRFFASRGEIEDPQAKLGHAGYALSSLRGPLGKNEWFFTPLTNLTTSHRDFQGLYKMGTLDKKMLQVILKPTPDHFPPLESDPPAKIDSQFTPVFLSHFKSSFNGPQLSAIRWAAAQVASENSKGKNKKTDQLLDLNKPPEISNGGELGDSWPFTLVQGPPGTGKTHTIWGMLNVINLILYQRYFNSLVEKLSTTSTVGEILSNLRNPQAFGISHKPRILVSAPSNAAVDELLARVVDKKFLDGEMREYTPAVIRVGTDPVTKVAQDFSVENLTNNLLNTRVEDLDSQLNKLTKDLDFLVNNMKLLKEQLDRTDKSKEAQKYFPLVVQFAHGVDELKRQLFQVQRYESAYDFACGGSKREAARMAIEISFLNGADIVFSTLASTGRKIFSKLEDRFDVLVVDEAAQACEVAVLGPLGLTKQRCILVGDPQQLPATVISKRAQDLMYSRSLFERLQIFSCPSIFLSVQFRMHPSIREFPSKYFYSNRLSDSLSVTNMEPEPWYQINLLKPYLFFDVSGREKQVSSSQSYQNGPEADMAVALFTYLQEKAKEFGASWEVPVGVVTPYRQQLSLLRRKFDPIMEKHKFPPMSLYLNTVDAFQGQERDVIILSCVRASPNRGVGFVSDIQRMNVAITRAKRALWILGSAASLTKSQAWADLIADAKSRGCVVDCASIDLFPGARKERFARGRGQNHPGHREVKLRTNEGTRSQTVPSKREVTKKNYDVVFGRHGIEINVVEEEKTEWIPPCSPSW